MSVRDRIIELKNQRNLKQTDIARLSGIPQPTYNKYEKGERAFPLDAIIKIANALSVNPLELLKDECGLSDSEVSAKLQHVIIPKKEIHEFSQLMEATLQLNSALKELGHCLTSKEIETLDSMLGLCHETLMQEAKKHSESTPAKTA